MKGTRILAGGCLLMLVATSGCARTTDTRPALTHDERAGFEEPIVTVVEDGDPVTNADGEAGKVPEASREAIPVEGTDLVRGRSTVVVHAPLEVVRSTVLDFDAYPDFMPHYANARELGRKKGGTREVYMQWSALHGAIKMWARFEMTPRKEGDTEIWESRFIDGNVKSAVASWTMKPLDDSRTELTLEVFLWPKLPMPTSLLNDENLGGAVKGVTAMRKRCEELAR